MKDKKQIKSKYLLFIAFISGFSIMAIELAASRLLAPFFGNSLFIWTNIIGLIMVFLSLGYYFGGKLADKNPDPLLILRIIFFAAIFILFIPFLLEPIVSISTIDSLMENHASLVIIIGSFLTTLVLFIVPISLLGMVSPFIIKLLIIGDKKEEGTKSGLVFAFSTVGSILGTFLSSLVSIPFLGTNYTVFAAAAILLVCTTPFIFKKKLYFILVFLSFVLYYSLWGFYNKLNQDKSLVFEDESVYHHIKIREKGEYSYLHLLGDNSFSSLYKEDLGISGTYFDYFSLLPYVESNKKEKSVVIVGMAGGTMVHQYNNILGNEFNFQINGVELDKKLISIVKERFNLKYDNLNVHNIDGRMFFRQKRGKYDIIIIDAFSKQLYIPHHLATKEFFAEISSHLTNKGVMAINVVAFSPDSKILKAVLNTLSTSFNHVYVAPSEHSFNYFVLGSNQEIDFANIENQINNKSLKKIAGFVKGSVKEMNYDPHTMVLTDDRAPTEFLTDKMAFKYLMKK